MESVRIVYCGKGFGVLDTKVLMPSVVELTDLGNYHRSGKIIRNVHFPDQEFSEVG